MDAAMGAVTAGALKGGGALVRAAVKRAPAAARAVTNKVGNALGGQCPCFASGTTVMTPDGPRAIDTIKIGDVVVSRDDVTGETSVKPVTRVFVTPDKEVMELTFQNVNGAVETITATPGHPFWVDGAGWTEARDLRVGIAVQTAESGLATLSAVLSRNARTTVYNLEVEGTHTYFVGDTEAWVHNACGCGAIPDDAFVVRGGITTPQQLKTGTTAHRNVPGLTGFSAQSRANATVAELASAGGVGETAFRNGQVSVTTAGKLRCIGCEVTPSPGAGASHVTVESGVATFEEISAQFAQQPNPGR